MCSYERSVPYPHGHRNCVFAQRGVCTLPRLAEPDMEKRYVTHVVRPDQFAVAGALDEVNARFHRVA